MKRFAAIALASLAATPALAHPGHEGADLASGLLHPLTGLDHMAAMLMVGLWAGLIAGRAMWALPMSFLTAMLLGFGYGTDFFAVDTGTIDTLILLSLVVLGGLLLFRLRAPLALAAGAAALFGFAHGMAHGLDSGGQASSGFVAGFLLTTALLHAAGLFLARTIPTGRVAGTA